MRTRLALPLIAALLPLATLAEDAPKAETPKAETPAAVPACVNHISTQNTLDISFNGQANTLNEAQTKLALQKKNIESEIKKFGSEPKLTVGNFYSNIAMSSNNYSPPAMMFTYSGGGSYAIQDDELAQKLLTRLTELQWMFSYNSSASHCD